MSNMILKVTPAEVRAKANELEKQKNHMEQMMKDMQQEVNKLPAEFWKSQSGMDYNGKYQSVQKNCNGSLNTLMTHIRNLLDAAVKYEDIERNQVQKVGALDTSNIFS